MIDEAQDAREQRGLVIAATCRLKQKGKAVRMVLNNEHFSFTREIERLKNCAQGIVDRCDEHLKPVATDL